MMALTFWHPERPLDAVDLLYASRVDYQQLTEAAGKVVVGKLTLPLASILDLITMKEDAGAVRRMKRMWTHCGGSSMLRNEQDRTKGVWHAKSTEELLAFAKIPAEEKLTWLETVRQTLQALPPERQETIQKFRDGLI